MWMVENMPLVVRPVIHGFDLSTPSIDNGQGRQRMFGSPVLGNRCLVRLFIRLEMPATGKLVTGIRPRPHRHPKVLGRRRPSAAAVLGGICRSVPRYSEAFTAGGPGVEGNANASSRHAVAFDAGV